MKLKNAICKLHVSSFLTQNFCADKYWDTFVRIDILQAGGMDGLQAAFPPPSKLPTKLSKRWGGWMVPLATTFCLTALLGALFMGQLKGSGSVPPPVADADGYWGKVTANTDWCEANYQVTWYVAEFWNTLSSLLIVFWALYGLVRHANTPQFLSCLSGTCQRPQIPGGPCSGPAWKHAMEPRFFVCFLLLAVIGVGSALYHGTLLRENQLLDELPMVWFTFVATYIVLCMRDQHPNPTPRFWLPLGLLVATVGLTAYVIWDTEQHDIFIVAFAIGTAINVHTTGQLKILHEQSAWMVNRLLATIAGGVVCWIADQALCHALQPLYLHAVWHTAISFAAYDAIRLWLLMRQTVRGAAVSVTGQWPFSAVTEFSNSCDGADACHPDGDKAHFDEEAAMFSLPVWRKNTLEAV
eukprot:g18707.t1